MNKLYLMTLTWQAKDKLSKLKDSLMPALEGLDYEWWIKSNACSDGTLEMIKSWDNPKIHLIEYKNNLQNFSQGMNHIFHEMGTKDNDYVLLLNNDVMFGDTSSIKEMIKLMDEPGVGVVGAKLLYTDTNRLQHAGVVFHPYVKMPLHFRTNEVEDANSDKNRLFQVVTGAVLLTKAGYYRKAFKNTNGIEGMDENYHWAFDDVDLCLSIGKNLNKKIVYCGKTKIYHEESASLKKNPANKLFMNQNQRYFLDKWGNKVELDLETYKANVKHNLYK